MAIRQNGCLSLTIQSPFFRVQLISGSIFSTPRTCTLEGVSEEILGTLLKGQREQVVIATKVHGRMRENDPNGEGLSRKHIMHEIDASLKRLQTDRIDLYQIHRWDYTTPIEETLQALGDIVRSGKAIYIGASSMWAWQFAKSLYLSDIDGSPSLCQHAESIQPGLQRGRKGDDPAVQGPKDCPNSLEPAGSGIPFGKIQASRIS